MSSCGYRKFRAGYDVKEYPKEIKKVPIYYSSSGYDKDSNMRVIGMLKLEDTGFTTNCHEDDAHNLLRKEATALNADLIIIYNELRADKKSTCYRCTADFIKKIDQDVAIQFEVDLKTTSVEDRVKKDKKNNRNVMRDAAILGGISGFMSSFFLLMQ